MRIFPKAESEQDNDRHDGQRPNQRTLRVHCATPGSAARIEVAGTGAGVDEGTRTPTALSRSAHARRQRAVGHMEISAPHTTINPPSQIHGTTGWMITLSVAVEPSLANDISVI